MTPGTESRVFDLTPYRERRRGSSESSDVRVRTIHGNPTYRGDEGNWEG